MCCIPVLEQGFFPSQLSSLSPNQLPGRLVASEVYVIEQEHYIEVRFEVKRDYQQENKEMRLTHDPRREAPLSYDFPVSSLIELRH
jgi:hypothetical protein